MTAVPVIPIAAQQPGPLNIVPINEDSALVHWPADSAGILEESADLGWLDDWSQSLITPIVTSGENTIVIPLTGASRYFRLSLEPDTQNDPPELQPVSDQTVTVGTTIIIQLAATDPEGAPLTFGVLPVPLPQGSSFDAATGRLEYRTGTGQIGTNQITFTVSDGCRVATQSVRLTVTPPAAGGTTAVSGRVLDTTDAVAGQTRPVSGVRVSLLGVPATAITGADGRFSLSGIPSGKQVLDLDTASAALAPDGSPYAGFREEITLLESIDNIVTRPFYLPRVDVSSLTPLSPTTATVVRNPNLNISMTVAPQTARLNGAPFTGSLSISLVPNALAPAALPSFLQPGMLITIQPVGVSFTTPAPITFPNLDNLPPGTTTNLWSLDAGIGQFVVVGTGRVSADGQRIDTVTGGIRATDWHAPLPPSSPPTPPPDAPPDDDDPDDDCEEDSGSVVSLVSGVVRTDFSLPPITAMGRPQAARFVYHSDRAWPHPILPGELTIPAIAAVPRRVSFAVTVAGVTHPTAFVDTQALNEQADENFRVAVDFDALGLPTGAYPYSLRAVSHYASSGIAGDSQGRVVVVNGQKNAFGAGWDLDGLSRLVINPDGSALVVDGGGATTLFSNPERRDLLIQNPAATAILRYDGVTGRLIGNFTQPGAAGITSAHNPTFGPDGNLYVIGDGPRIFRFDGVTGAFIDVFVGPGTPGFNKPAQMAWGPDGDLYTDLAGTDGRQVFRWDGQTGQFSGVAASGQGIQRICGIAFGSDGLLYVADQDRFAGTRYDRILRFNGTTGAFVDVFVPSGNLDDTCPFEFGADGDIFIADQWTRDIRRFNGATGAFKGVFASGAPISNPVPFYARSGPDGLLYIVNSAGIHRYRDTGTPGTFVDTFIPGAAGFFTFTPAPQPSARIAYLSPPGDHSLLLREADGRFVRQFPHGVRHEYSATGKLEAIADRNGNRDTYQYDAAGLLTSITDIAGGVTAFVYESGRLLRVTDPAGRTSVFSQNASGDLERVSLPDGSQRAFGYDDRHLMVTETGPGGGNVRREYDRVGRLARAIQADGSVRTASNARSTGLPNLGAGAGTEANPLPVIRSVSAVSRFRDGASVETTYTTGAFGEGARVAAADGTVTSWQRDEDGNALKTTLPSGQVADATFDDHGNPLTLRNSSLGNGTSGFQYDPNLHLLTQATDAGGNTTRLERDDRGNITAIRSPSNRVTHITYDARGLAQQVTSLTGMVQTNSYDPGGRLATATMGAGPQQRVLQFEYSAAGDLTRFIDPSGAVSLLEYDPMGRVRRSVEPGGGILTFGYDGGSHLLSVRRNGREPHQFRYTLMGDLAEYLPPGTSSGAGSTRYQYDSAQRLTRTLRADARECLTSYNAAGKIASLQFDTETTNYLYGATTGQLVRIDTTGGPSVAYSYAGEQVATATWSGPVQGTVRATANNRGLPASVQVNALPSVNYVYDADGLLIQAGELTLVRNAATGLVASATAGAVVQEWQYNEFGEIIRHSARHGATVLLVREYERDKLGRITLLRESRGGPAQSKSYLYDPDGQLTGVVPDTGPVRSYAYDQNGNRTAAPGLNGEATYDAQDRLTAYGNLGVSFSPDGEMIRRDATPNQARNITYDALGRLRRCTLPDGRIVTHLLDGRDRLVARLIDGNLDRAWLYSDLDEVAAELDGPSNVRTVFVQTFEGAPDLMRRDGKRFVIIKDHLGSPRLVVDADSGAIAQEMSFDEFGVLTLDSAPRFQPFGFAGGMMDQDAGLTRFGQRWYDPGLGRWTSRDPEPPLEEAANLYAYASNDPVNLVDRTGAKPGNAVQSLKDPALDWITSQAMNSIRDSIRNIQKTISTIQMRINEQKGRLRDLRRKLAAAKKKDKELIRQQIKNTEDYIKSLEQSQLNLHSDLAAAYRALNAIKFGQWVPDNAFDPRNWLDPYRARFKPDW